jgi:hypothetical protein
MVLPPGPRQVDHAAKPLSRLPQDACDQVGERPSLLAMPTGPLLPSTSPPCREQQERLATDHLFSQATRSLSRSSPWLYDIALL